MSTPPSLGFSGPLQRMRDRLSLLQIGIATATVALADAVRPWSLATALLLAIWAFVRPLPTVLSPAAERAWTWGIAAALLATIARAVTTAELLDAGIDFLLLLVVQRLFNRQRTREHMQLLLLGSLLVVAGAVINAGLNYPLLFAAYLVVATMTLLLNHLVAEGERLGIRTAATVSREGMRVRPVLWRAAFTVAGIAGIGAIVTFVAFPRWGVGFFLRGGIARDQQSGFSSQVELGSFGRIKTDATVVMRIEPVGEWGTRPAWHLRGSSFDHYSRGRWSHAEDRASQLALGLGGFTVRRDRHNRPELAATPRSGELRAIPRPGFADSSDTLRATVILEDLGVDVLFVASEPVAVRVTPRGPIERFTQVQAGKSDEIRVVKPPGPIRYDFVSRVGMPSQEELRAVGDPEVPADLVAYTRRLEGLSPEVGALALELTAGATTRYDKVAALLAHLSTFSYTLDLQPTQRVLDGADPVEGFLFDSKAGHCEYFATALAVLGRQAGVPTRLVNGYYGAHWNPLGEFYAVRQADAHSWVEVYFDRLGWVTVDPTPPAGRVAGDDAGIWPAAGQVIDAIRNAYLAWIIDYDLGKQLTLFENLGLRDRTSTSGLGRWRRVLIGIAIVIAVGFAATRIRRRRGAARPEVAIYQRVLARLARLGHTPTASESPRRFCARVCAAEPSVADALADFGARYEEIRFGRPGSITSLVALRGCAAALLATLPRRRRRP